MKIFYRHSCTYKPFQGRSKPQKNLGVRLTVFLLCLSVLAGFLPELAMAADNHEKLCSIVNFQSIELHYPGVDGQIIGAKVQDHALIEKGERLVLQYTYEITEEQCSQIVAGTNYYLEVSPHLLLPDLGSGSPLTVKTEEGGEEKFGTIYADGSNAWVVFDEKPDGGGTVLSDYGGLLNANFYLECRRAGQPPEGESPVPGYNNLYAIKFETGDELYFGYQENEPVTAKATIDKRGSFQDKTITWEIDYTPWQNPTSEDPVTANTPFELQDTIDTSLHHYVPDSVTIDGASTAVFTSRDDIPQGIETYLLVEGTEGGSNTTLNFGGTKFNPGKATQGDTISPLKITYQTSVNDDLLLTGGAGGKTVTNAAEVLAGADGAYTPLNIKSSSTVTIPKSTWLTKEGKTTRNPGNGSVTDWEVTFLPNGFSFTGENNLTLHDQLPAGSTLVADTVQVNGAAVTAETGENNDFTVSPILTDHQLVTITYQTQAPEDMYDSGTSLGNNVAWFTFGYGGKDYETPKATTPVGSGDGTGTPGTATLVKTNSGYHAATRTIAWTVTINPHRAYLKSGTFTDDLKIGSACGISGHTGGLELVGGEQGITISIDGAVSEDPDLVQAEYHDQQIMITAGNIGAKTITLTYTTKVCDPCIFANNTSKATFTNTISTKNMVIGKDTAIERSASAESTAKVSAAVLTKKAPVYDYASGTMKWTVEVDAAELSMDDVHLTDHLPAGLTYVEDSLITSPAISEASASAQGQELTIYLGIVGAKTTVTFDTLVDPEKIGFSSNGAVAVQNTIYMNGRADGVTFAEVSHSVKQNFSNHGLVKSSAVNNRQELIQYEVLINPFGLALPEKPSLVDTLDARLQLDTDSLRFYKAKLTGTTASNAQKPQYTREGSGESLKITGFDPDTNSFTVELPISTDSRDAYVLAYTADIMNYQAGGYSNDVRFEGGSVLLGGNKNNSAVVGGGGGGGGGGVAARKAVLTVTKTDSENHMPLAGVSFLLYQWDSDQNMRGLPFAQGKTDDQGKLSFQVKPKGSYELVETESIPGYGSSFGWENLPNGVTETEHGLFITAGEAKTELALELTNEAHTTDIEFKLVNGHNIPMAGETVKIFTSDPTGTPDLDPVKEVTVCPDGTVTFSGIRRGAKYYILYPGGIMAVEVPAQDKEEPKVILPDHTSATLKDYLVTGSTSQEQQWALIVCKVIGATTTPLPGATIGLYADAACQTLIKSDVSPQDGIIRFPGLIKGQKYWLKEMEAPMGYQVNSTIYEASEADSNVTITNIPETPPVKPEEPDNPGASDQPNTPGESDKPDTPDQPDDPDTSDQPDNPDTSDQPDSPTTPEEPDNPDTSDEPDDSGTPDEPDKPGKPESPDESDQPGEPESPDESDRPEEPESPDESDKPEEPESPDESDQPGEPESPDESDQPGEPESPDESDQPGEPEPSDESKNLGEPEPSEIPDRPGTGGGRNSTNSSTPQTGDDTPLLIAATLVSAVLLIIMTLYRFLESKKHEKK